MISISFILYLINISDIQNEHEQHLDNFFFSIVELLSIFDIV